MHITDRESDERKIHLFVIWITDFSIINVRNNCERRVVRTMHVHSRLYDPMRSPFLQYASRPTVAQVVAETGFDPDVLEYLWHKYQSSLPNRIRSKHYRKMYFYMAFRYIHMYPTWDQAPVVLWSSESMHRSGAGITKDTLRKHVLTYIAVLAVVVDEVHWDDRLSQYNHTTLLPTRFTAIVDTAPVCVQESLNKATAKLTYQPKYSDNVFKLQVRACQRVTLLR